jgi:hypothetical protein
VLRIQDAKWNTVVKVADFVFATLEVLGGIAILHDYEWSEPPDAYALIVAALGTLLVFIEAAEADSVPFHHMFVLQRRLKAAWAGMAGANGATNPVAWALIQLPDERFTSTANGALMQPGGVAPRA